MSNRIAHTRDEAAVFEDFGLPYDAHFGPEWESEQHAKREAEATAAHLARLRARNTERARVEANAKNAEVLAEIAKVKGQRAELIAQISANEARIREHYGGTPEQVFESYLATCADFSAAVASGSPADYRETRERMIDGHFKLCTLERALGPDALRERHGIERKTAARFDPYWQKITDLTTKTP